MPLQRYFAFTTRSNGLRGSLQNDIFVSEGYDPNSGLPEPIKKQFIGIWDTGASGSVINSRVVNELNLVSTGQVWCSAVGDNGVVNRYLADTYIINIMLPNQVTIMGIVAAKGEIAGGDVLIGMDVITTGDFAVTNVNGHTTLSFRTPSIREIDFVREANESNRNHAQLNMTEDDRRRTRNKRKAENKKNKKR